ncbi:methyltransferase domain-containing protein [Rickettsiales bacterium]|nr:methyltransferase domain-containing protein [Rickettsiales bacterium]
MSNPPIIFNRRLVKMHRNRAAKNFEANDFLYKEVVDRLLDRLNDMDRKFDRVLDIGCHTGYFGQNIKGDNKFGTLIQMDLSQNMAVKAGGNSVVADEENLPFAPNSFDLIVSNLVLHWVNDLPGTFMQIRKMLKPDGVFIANIFGENNLEELRIALIKAEEANNKNIAARISPSIDIKTLGGLLQRTGFDLPVSDCETIAVEYSSAIDLLKDIKNMGQSNALARGCNYLSKDVIEDIDRHYCNKSDKDVGKIIANFDILTITGLASNDK